MNGDQLATKDIQHKEQEKERKATAKITGMTCTSCAKTIESALLKTRGVNKASVNFTTETAYIEYDDGKTSEKDLQKVIKDTGYDVFKGTQKIIL